MIKTVLEKVVRIGRATVFAVGLAATPALCRARREEQKG